MNTTIQKWGNSLAVRLPKEVFQKSDLHEGSAVTVRSDNGRVVITAVPEKQNKIILSKLLRGISSTNTYNETSWGDRRGNEVW